MAPRLRKFSIIGFGFLFTAILLLVFAPQFVPSEVYKDQVVQNIERATGRQVRIEGDIGLRFIPRVELVMGKVHLGNPKGFDESTDMLKLDELQLSLGFFPLMRGELDIHTLRLVNPVLNLERNAKGKPNWELSPKEPIEKTVGEKKEKGRRELKMPEMEIVNGMVIYLESPDAKPISLDQLNMKVKVPSLDDQLTIYADTRLYNRLPATLEARINTPADWLEGRETAYTAELRLDKDLMKLAAEGKASPHSDNGNTPNIQGSAHLAVRSLTELAEALEQPALGRVPEPGKLSLRSMFNWQDQKATLRGTTFSLDNTTLSGSGMINLAGKRPSITLDLISTDTLVLSGLTAHPGGNAPLTRTESEENPAGTGWSKEPLIADTSFLTAADADISVKMGGLKVDNVVLGAFQANARLANGTLRFSMPEASFYGGKGQINAEIGASGKTGLRISQNLQLTGANVGLFLRDAFAFDRLDGSGNLKLNINTRGDSEYDFVSNLGGTGSLSLENGAIRGFNLAETVRNVRGFVASVKDQNIAADMQSTDEAVKTDFSKFAGSFTIEQGILTNPDLALKAPLLDATGKGKVNIPQKTVDYRLRPTLVGSLEGEGRTQQTSGGLTIPLRVTGTFDHLKFAPDAESAVEKLLTDPEGGIKDMEQSVKGLRDDMKSLFKGL